MPMPLTRITAFEGKNQPSRDNADEFADWGDIWVAAEADGAEQHNVLAGQVNDMADAASDSQIAAAASQAAALASQNAAASSAATAATLAGAAMFNSSTTYTLGQAAISAVNFRTYRRRSAGSSATDPANDYPNWAPQPYSATLIIGTTTLDEGDYVFAGSYAATLPDLSTPKQLSLTLPSNLSAFSGSVTSADGWTVDLGFSAGITKKHVPMAFATPHGWWGSAPMTPPLNSTATPFAGNITGVSSSVALSASLHAYLLTDPSGTYVVGVDPTTGAVGGPASVNASWNGASFAFALTSTTMLVVSGNTARVVSFSGLNPTANTAQALSANVYECPVQLTATTFFLACNSATNDLVVLTVSGTSCSLGTAVSSGIIASTTNLLLAPVSATTVLLCYATSSSGSSSTTFRTASISGTTITMNATSITPGVNNPALNNTGVALYTINQGSSYIFTCSDNTTPTTGNWYGITVSGTAVTIGTISQQTNLLSNNYRRRNYIYRATSSGWAQLSNEFASVNSTTGLFKVTSGLMAISISGTTLTFGAAFTTGTPQAILVDVSTGANLYSIGTTSYSKLSISGTTITAAYTVANIPTFILSDTLTDKAVSYSANWYTWTLGATGTARVPISASKFATFVTNSMRIYGSFY